MQHNIHCVTFRNKLKGTGTMGLSSSQARLLNLTARMHQIEYKAAKLESQKLQMANESRHVYDEYLEALDSTKIQVKTLNNDGSASYKDIHSYQEFIEAGYALEFNGRIYNSAQLYTYTKPSGEKYYFETPTVTGRYWGGGQSEFIDMYGNTFEDEAVFYNTRYEENGVTYVTLTTNGIEGGAEDAFKELARDAFGANYTTEPTGKEFEEIITNLINSGDVTIVRLKDNSETSVAIDTGLQEVSDETLLRKAETKYEADMRKIDAKDRKYDTDLAALEAERNAIKSEMETLKTVAKDNVERTFKLFS